MQSVYFLPGYVASVGSEAACEAFWYVQKLVDENLFFLLLTQSVIAFRDDLDQVAGRSLEGFLPQFAQVMNASNCTTGFRMHASVAVDLIQVNVMKMQLRYYSFHKILDVLSLVVFDRHGL